MTFIVRTNKIKNSIEILTLLQDSQQARRSELWQSTARINTQHEKYSALSPAFINIQTTKDCYKYSFFHRTIADWNQLSPRTREATSVDAFKALLCVLSAHRLD